LWKSLLENIKVLKPCHHIKLSQLLPVILGAALVIAAAWLAGRAVAPKLVPALSFSLGAILLSYAVFALMIVHQARRPVLIGLLLACMAAGLARRPVIRLNRPPALVLAVCVPFAVWYLVNALAPEIEADPNVYHLQPALDALRFAGFSGNISFYERLPHSVEMLFVPAWLIGGASAAKLVHFAFLLATLPVIVHIARRLDLPEIAGHIAAALYFCTPIVGLAGTAAFNDAALVYFTIAAIALALDGKPAHAGLVAGFCYAVKMTGLIAVPVAVAFFVARKQWRSAIVCGAAAAVTCSPWLIRNLIETGNPLAPFLNRWFPNPYFYVLTEQTLAANLRNYGVPFWERFPELLAGSRLQGIIGPAFMIAPVALLALRRRTGALLVTLALVLSLSWWMNAGARFLMPTLPFLTLAICAALPGRIAIGILVLHAVTSWPTLVSAYTPRSLQLKRFPWKAALRLESERDYLNRTSLDYQYAKLAENNTPPNARILDLIGVHRALADREFIGSWSTALGIRSLEALEFARVQGKPALKAIDAVFDTQPVCGFRLIETANTPELWNLHSVELRKGGTRTEDRSGWSLSSSVNRWELPFAFDRNLVSRWSTWQAAERGMFVQADFAKPVEADSIQVLTPAGTTSIDVRVEICQQGRWQRVPARSADGPLLNLRPAAVETLKKAGITHILTPAAYQGVGFLGERLINEADEWNLEVVANLYAIYLLKLR
jgi:hypothetical protein